MRLDVVRRVAMLAVIPALILLIGLTESRVVIDIHGAVDHYMYRSISLEIRGEDNVSFQVRATRTDSYDLQVNFSRNATVAFDVYAVIADRQGNTFALNATVFHGTDDGGDFVAMTDRATLRTVFARPPADVRALVPRGDGG